MIAAGGTGGHVYPALAVAEAIIKQHPQVSLYFVGTLGGFERPLVERSTVPFQLHVEVQAGPLNGVNPFRAMISVAKLIWGTMQSLRLLWRYKPQVVFSTGGWVSLPVALASWLARVPLLIYLPDIEPALTIKVLRFFARKVAITVPESARYFREGQTVVTGYPLRSSFSTADRQQAIAHFGLDPHCQTLLVAGGSRGSRAINMIVGDILKQLLDAGIQVIHLTGTLDWARTQEQIGELSEHPHYHGYDYLHEAMPLAYAAADLVVCRSGASILGEFPLFSLPSILIPLAYSWRYQQVNAEYLAAQGAAIHLNEADAPEKLLPTVIELLGDPERLVAMQDAVSGAARHDGASNVAEVLAQLARERS